MELFFTVGFPFFVKIVTSRKAKQDETDGGSVKIFACFDETDNLRNSVPNHFAKQKRNRYFVSNNFDAESKRYYVSMRE
jgi:hypothetical protein